MKTSQKVITITCRINYCQQHCTTFPYTEVGKKEALIFFNFIMAKYEEKYKEEEWSISFGYNIIELN